MAHVLDAGNRAAIQRAALHHAGIERHRADAVRQPAVTDRAYRGIVLDGLRPG